MSHTHSLLIMITVVRSCSSRSPKYCSLRILVTYLLTASFSIHDGIRIELIHIGWGILRFAHCYIESQRAWFSLLIYPWFTKSVCTFRLLRPACHNRVVVVLLMFSIHTIMGLTSLYLSLQLFVVHLGCSCRTKGYMAPIGHVSLWALAFDLLFSLGRLSRSVWGLGNLWNF